MTHSLHRRGDHLNLQGDFVVLSIAARGLNQDGARQAFVDFLERALRHNPINFGDMKTGNSLRVSAGEIVERMHDNSIIHAVFRNSADVAAFLAELKEADNGVSVVVSGLMDQVHECCRRAGLEPHTIEHSLGIKGRTDRLPPEDILRITTMCGHGMVSANLVRKAAMDCKAGRTTFEEAARVVARPCECGIFNPARARDLLVELAATSCTDEW